MSRNRITDKNGFLMIKYSKKKVEEKLFTFKLETREIISFRSPGTQKSYDSIDIREIKEIRKKKAFRDFEETNKVDVNRCFSILFGNSFVLKIWSLCAATSSDVEKWIQGLEILIDENKHSTTPLIIERWLRKEFYKIEKNKLVCMRHLKPWLLSVNQRLSNMKIKEIFQESGSDFKDLNFEDFRDFYKKLIMQNIPDIVENYFKNKQIIEFDEFKNFLLDHKMTPQGDDEIKELVSHFLDNPYKPHQNEFSRSEFCDYLFSKENSIFDSYFNKVTQDMDRPLTDYWIASSHNTYLTGDQIKSESSTEAYARVLRMGCRCIELDCWDGPDQYPVIFHGYTLTTKIKFMEVLKVIKEHAWVTSDFPLILSIENHCSLAQQRNMASGFKNIFAEDLLVEPLSTASNLLPSPNQLRKKIILKHKKLAETEDLELVKSEENLEQDIDLTTNSLKKGILYMPDPSDQNKMNPHYFMLFNTRLYYSEHTRVPEDQDEASDEGSAQFFNSTLDYNTEEMHFSEKWFHGKLPGGREEAERLLKKYSYLGNGTFLVRESETFVGDYSLSFWRNGSHNHCRIRSKHENNKTMYFLVEQNLYDSLYSLIMYYKSNPLKSHNFEQILTEPVPQPEAHIDKDWYYDNLSRDQAEDKLSRIRKDGVFLVRRRQAEHKDNDDSQYAISFRSDGKIKHCKIKREDRLFTIGSMSFETLVDLVNYYKKDPLYHKMKLRFAVTDQLIRELGENPSQDCIYHSNDLYQSPNEICKNKVRTLYDYKAVQPDELSFSKNSIITNVQKKDGEWWKGDYENMKQGWFLANYVEEIENEVEVTESMPLGTLQKGFIDLAGVTVYRLPSRPSDLNFIFRIISPHQAQPINLGAPTEEDMLSWFNKIRECSNLAEKKVQQIHIKKKSLKIAKELSDIIVYCQPVKYSEDKVLSGKMTHYEMFSIPETRVFDKSLQGRQNIEVLLKANRKTLTRIYPKSQRIDSSNYDPLVMWNCGCQISALNYQTPDRSMQLNQGRFLMNGQCGYVLKPDCLKNESFSPLKVEKKISVTVSIQILGARHLIRNKKGVSSPFVEVEIIGCSYDNSKYKTKTCTDNGLNPIWKNENCTFEIFKPEMCLIRFLVQDEDMFGDPNFLGQATFPISCLRTGIRSVPLKNEFSEPLELSSILINFSIEEQSEKEITKLIKLLKNELNQIQKDIEKCQGGKEQLLGLSAQKSKTENLILEKTHLRQKLKQMK